MKAWDDWMGLVSILGTIWITVAAANWPAVMGWCAALAFFCMSLLWRNLAKRSKP